jgi:Na+/H+-translocating membrane pyrophosphatase
MTLMDGLKAAAMVSLAFSWIALLIALAPALLLASVAETRRWHYGIAGLLGGVIGGFGGAASLFLSLWFGCRGQGAACNTALGDMGLLVTFPAGSFFGCLVAPLCMRIFSGLRPLRRWAYAIGSQIAFWSIMILLFGRLMA